MKYEIEIEGLPEGWEPVDYRHPADDEDVLIEGEIRKGRNTNKCYEQLVVKKKQPRRIVLEETDRYSDNIKTGEFGVNTDGSFHRCSEPNKWGNEYRVWREVKETDLSLNNEEPKLSLTVNELNSLLDTIDINVVRKIQQFLKDK